jgi:thiol-disulfide isomerase/thioredoxin
MSRGGNVYYSCVRIATFLLLFSLTLGLSVGLAGCYHGSKPSSIGAAAPDFTVTDSDRSVTLSKLRGHIVVLNFWATWCPPCVEEMPSLTQLQKMTLNKGVIVLAVSVDDDADDYHRFLKEYKVDLLTVREGGQKTDAGVISPTANLYGTSKIPESYIIDRNGIVQRKFIGPIDWSQAEIVEYLSKQ